MSVKVNALPVESNPAMTDYTINDSASLTTKRTLWQKIFNLFVANGMLVVSSAQGITAAGTNQGTATALTKTNNRVDTVAAGTGVKDGATAVVGFTRTVQNNGANDLLYYPFAGNNFFGLGANLPITIAAGNQASVFCYSTGELTII